MHRRQYGIMRDSEFRIQNYGRRQLLLREYHTTAIVRELMCKKKEKRKKGGNGHSPDSPPPALVSPHKNEDYVLCALAT